MCLRTASGSGKNNSIFSQIHFDLINWDTLNYDRRLKISTLNYIPSCTILVLVSTAISCIDISDNLQGLLINIKIYQNIIKDV